MALISCSVFKPKIWDGTKSHTIRSRRIPPKVGENLYLWWKSRTKDKEYLGTTVCTKVEPISINPIDRSVIVEGESLLPVFIELLAKNDGFDSVELFWQYFNEPKEGSLIHWNPDFITLSKFRPEVLDHIHLLDNVPELPKESDRPEDIIREHWCGQCERQKKKAACPIYMTALLRSLAPHWVKHEGQEICTSFLSVKNGRKVRPEDILCEVAKGKMPEERADGAIGRQN